MSKLSRRDFAAVGLFFLGLVTMVASAKNAGREISELTKEVGERLDLVKGVRAEGEGPGVTVEPIEATNEATLRYLMAKGGEFKLANDITVTKNFTVKDKSVVIDLNNHNITLNAQWPFSVEDKGSLTITGTGRMTDDESNHPYMIFDLTGHIESGDVTTPSLTIDEGVTIESNADYGMAIFQVTNTDKSYGATINIKGTIDIKGMLVTILGNIKQTEGNIPSVTIASTARLKSRDDLVVYGAGYGKWTIEDGAELTGKNSAIEMRAGIANIKGGKFVSQADPNVIKANGNGTTSAGAAVAIAQHSTNLPTIVNIKDGSFTGYLPLIHTNAQNNNDEAAEKVVINIEGGTFTSSNTTGKTNMNINDQAIELDVMSVYSVNKTKFICGGTFSHRVDDSYIKDNCYQFAVATNSGTQYYATSSASLSELVGSHDLSGATITPLTNVKYANLTAVIDALDDLATTTNNVVHVDASSISNINSNIDSVVRNANGTYDVNLKVASLGDTADTFSNCIAELMTLANKNIHLVTSTSIQGAAIDYVYVDGTKSHIVLKDTKERGTTQYGLQVINHFKNTIANRVFSVSMPYYTKEVTVDNEDGSIYRLQAVQSSGDELVKLVEDARNTSPKYSYNLIGANATIIVNQDAVQSVTMVAEPSTVEATIDDAHNYATKLNHQVEVADVGGLVFYTLVADGKAVTSAHLTNEQALAIANDLTSDVTITGSTIGDYKDGSEVIPANSGINIVGGSPANVTNSSYQYSLSLAQESTHSANITSGGTNEVLALTISTSNSDQATVNYKGDKTGLNDIIDEVVEFINNNSASYTYTITGFQGANISVVNGKVTQVEMTLGRTAAQRTAWRQRRAVNGYSFKDSNGLASCAVVNNNVLTIVNQNACVVEHDSDNQTIDQASFAGSYEQFVALSDNFVDQNSADNIASEGSIYYNSYQKEMETVVNWDVTINAATTNIDVKNISERLTALRSTGDQVINIASTSSAVLKASNVEGFGETFKGSVTLKKVTVIHGDYQLTFDANGIPTLTYTGTSAVTGDAIYTELTHWLANTKIANIDQLTFDGTGAESYTNVKSMSVTDGKLNVAFASDETVSGVNKVAGVTSDFAALYNATAGHHALVTDKVTWSDMTVSYTGEATSAAMTIAPKVDTIENEQEVIISVYKNLATSTLPETIVTRTLNIGEGTNVKYALKQTKQNGSETNILTVVKANFADGLDAALTLAGTGNLAKPVGVIWQTEGMIELATAKTDGSTELRIVGAATDNKIIALAEKVADTFANVSAVSTGAQTALSPSITSFATDGSKKLTIIYNKSSNLMETLAVTNIKNVTLDTSAQISNKVNSIVKTTGESTSSAILTMSGLTTADSDKEASAAAIALAQNGVPYASVNGLVTVDSSKVWIESVTSDDNGVVTVTTKLSAANAKSLAENLNQQLTSGKATRIVVTDAEGKAHQGSVYASLAQAIKGLAADSEATKAEVSNQNGADNGAKVTKANGQYSVVLANGVTTDQAVALMSGLISDTEIDTSVIQVALQASEFNFVIGADNTGDTPVVTITSRTNETDGQKLDDLVVALPDELAGAVVSDQHTWNYEAADSTQSAGVLITTDLTIKAGGQSGQYVATIESANITLQQAVALFNSLSEETKTILSLKLDVSSDGAIKAKSYSISQSTDGRIAVVDDTANSNKKTIADDFQSLEKIVAMLPDVNKEDLLITDGEGDHFTYRLSYMPYTCAKGIYCSNVFQDKILVHVKVANATAARAMLDVINNQVSTTYIMMIEFDSSYVAMATPQLNSSRFSLIRSAHAADVTTYGVYVENGVNKAIVTNQIDATTQSLMDTFGVSEVMITSTQVESGQGAAVATPVNLVSASEDPDAAKQALSDFQSQVTEPGGILTGDDFTATNNANGELASVEFTGATTLAQVKQAMSATTGTVSVTHSGKTYTFVNGKLKESSKNESHSSSSNSTSSSSNSGSSSSDAKPAGCSANVPVGTPDLFQIDRQGSKATLYFTPVRDNTDRYHVVFGNVAGQELYGGIAMQVDADRNNGVIALDIDNLQPGQQYSFKVAPVNDCAVGTWSNWLTAKGVARYGKTTVKTYRYTGK